MAEDSAVNYWEVGKHRRFTVEVLNCSARAEVRRCRFRHQPEGRTHYVSAPLQALATNIWIRYAGEPVQHPADFEQGRVGRTTGKGTRRDRLLFLFHHSSRSVRHPDADSRQLHQVLGGTHRPCAREVSSSLDV